MIRGYSCSLYVQFQVPGIHCWLDAPIQLHFVQQPHRHVFRFKVTYDVVGLDRDLEFFELQTCLQRSVLELYEQDEHVVNFLCDSCETIAYRLLQRLPSFVKSIEVSEDGENGAIVSRSNSCT